ncbi:peroxiredoxin [Spiroplasma taiwanense]|uniref:thioredoxin-dependent peroxiredoxin n=1 Tax=Spiroplasma taiwanense CT-1 TaxID=1276220 RepID=S5M0U6_9MOLU|nr:peroxiredoxin [Spiroplasma taiwanense]AGR41627.1 ahpC/TSA family protein [Spiroplasma taiwanense CT-1]
MKLENKKYLLDSNKEVQLNELVGEKGLIMFFYPKAHTSGCILEVQEYEKRNIEFKDLGFNIVGVSGDDVENQNSFSCDYVLNYPLIADVNRELIANFNLEAETTTWENQTIKITKRNTYVLNKNLEVIKEFSDVDPVGHINDVINFLKK